VRQSGARSGRVWRGRVSALHAGIQPSPPRFQRAGPAAGMRKRSAASCARRSAVSRLVALVVSPGSARVAACAPPAASNPTMVSVVIMRMPACDARGMPACAPRFVAARQPR